MVEGSKSGSAVKCAMCGKEIKNARGLGPHMRVHKRNPPVTVTPPLITTPSQPGGFGGAGSSPPVSNLPAPQGTPPLDPSLLIGLLSSLAGGRKDPAEEAFREAYTKFIKAVAELPSSFMLGMQSGLKDAVKAYVKEELKEVREEIGKFLEEARSKATRERSAESGGKKVEGKPDLRS